MIRGDSWTEAAKLAARVSLATTLAVALILTGCSPEAEFERATAPTDAWRAGPALPSPVTNNAVAAVETADGVAVFSFLGLDASKLWSGVTNAAYRWDVGSDSWREIEPVPGPGRLASTAQVFDGRIYVIGGYTVAADGSERSVPDVNVYDPITEEWSRGADIPLPTDDAVSGLWQDSLIVLVSGWHDTGNVTAVQIYDPRADRWSAGSPIPGVPVFGHTGAVAGDYVVYVDGAAVVDAVPRFQMETSSWVGRLDVANGVGPVEWASVPQHPGAPMYRAAGGRIGALVVFVGGTDNPYNYNGVGYDGVPSEPVRRVLAFAPLAGIWRDLPAPPVATMDHRTLGVAGGLVFLAGGMRAGQVVSDQLWYADAEALVGAMW